jgi:hypothetical protein
MTYWIAMLLLVAALAVPSRAASAILAVLMLVVLICRPAIDRRWKAFRHHDAPADAGQSD